MFGSSPRNDGVRQEERLLHRRTEADGVPRLLGSGIVKAVAMVTAVVLVVIGIGVGVTTRYPTDSGLCVRPS